MAENDATQVPGAAESRNRQGMTQDIIRSLAEFDAIAEAMLEEGDTVGMAHAVVGPGEELVGVQAFRLPHGSGTVTKVYTFNARPIPGTAVGMLLAAYGATALPWTTRSAA